VLLPTWHHRSSFYREIPVSSSVWWRWREKTPWRERKAGVNTRQGALAHHARMRHKTNTLNYKVTRGIPRHLRPLFIVSLRPVIQFHSVTRGASVGRHHGFKYRLLIVKADMWRLGGGGRGEGSTGERKGGGTEDLIITDWCVRGCECGVKPNYITF